MSQINLGKVVGDSAYEIAVKQGFSGTETEWLSILEGKDGVSPTVTVKTNTESEYTLTITDVTGSFNTPNLKGSSSSGSGGSYDDTEVRQLIANNTESIVGKQDNLISGTNIKTVNNQPILGSGNINISTGEGVEYGAGENVNIENNTISFTFPPSNSVSYTEDIRSEAEKEQARINLGIIINSEPPVDPPVDPPMNTTAWELGAIMGFNGQTVEQTNSPSTTRARTVDILSMPESVSMPDGWLASRRYLDENDLISNADGAWQTPTDGVLAVDSTQGVKFRLVLSKSDNSDITNEELTFITNNVIFNYTESSTQNISVLSTSPQNITVLQTTDKIIRGNEDGRALYLACALERNGLGMANTPCRFLWYDHNYTFFVSDSVDGYKEYAFKWTHSTEPKYYSFAMVNDGDILAVYRTEAIIEDHGGVDYRQNPLFFKRSNYYAMSEIVFTGTKPSGWIANQGFTVDSINKCYYMVEYTRPSVPFAYAWKITGDPSIASNWSIIQEQELSGDAFGGMKHYHCVQIDPYTGYVYLTTGDDDSAAKIYVSKDGGTTIDLVYGPNETYCRMLNFQFTPTHVYWATDSGIAGKHKLFKATRDVDNVIDVANAQIMWSFPDYGINFGVATYACVYIKALECLVFLEREDSTDGGELPVYVWDLLSENMHTVDMLYGTGEYSVAGFRCNYYSLNPSENRVITGFGYASFGYTNTTNGNSLLGNTSGKIGNIIMVFNRVGDGFTVTYDTVK